MLLGGRMERQALAIDYRRHSFVVSGLKVKNDSVVGRERSAKFPLLILLLRLLVFVVN